MAFIDRIWACNHWQPDQFIPFWVDGYRLGWMRPAFGYYLRQWPTTFLVAEDGVRLHPSLVEFKSRTEAVSEVVRSLVEQGLVSHWHGELYPVGLTRWQPLLLLDRGAVPYFGIRAYGQHVNGVVRDGKQLLMWVGRRSPHKRTFPNLLDQIVAGGLPHGISMADNLKKECQEEAGIPPALALRASPVGALTYCRETAMGLKPDTIYCYDLKLPKEFSPRCTDGEVHSFALLPLEEVMETIRDTEAFKPNCALVVLDFLLRHGWFRPENEDYLNLVQGLHPVLPY